MGWSVGSPEEARGGRAWSQAGWGDHLTPRTNEEWFEHVARPALLALAREAHSRGCSSLFLVEHGPEKVGRVSVDAPSMGHGMSYLVRRARYVSP